MGTLTYSMRAGLECLKKVARNGIVSFMKIMLYMTSIRPNLNTQSDSIRAKLYCQIIIIITLFKFQIILAEHKCSTNWGDSKSNQIKCWFLRREENRSSQRKTSRSRVEDQQAQPTYDAGSGNCTRDTLVGGERSHHCAIPAPQWRCELIIGISFLCQ